MASLIVVSGANEGDYYPLGVRTWVIGRGENCPIQLVDERVSRKHCQIRFDEKEDTHHVIDLKSANGVFVNGRQITGDTLLRDNDIIEAGGSKLMYTVEEFEDRESALNHYKVRGERGKSTLAQ